MRTELFEETLKTEILVLLAAGKILMLVGRCASYYQIFMINENIIILIYFQIIYLINKY